MILIETVIGDMREPELAAQLHRLEHADAVDTVTLGSADLARRRLRVTSERGADVAIALPRDVVLFNGAVLQLDDSHALIVRAAPTDWLRIIPHGAAAALELGYHAGNLHWRVRFAGSELLVAMDGPRAAYRARIARLVDDGLVTIAETASA
ncbi:Urease accessory protein UreE 1 [Beijerinckiaceae bacterium RH AL1]|nr:urease accessory protein UreE [Beijerinckiaceae bacterium]VVB46882.1 Urease accessory protein UreE 1 [Beijerinckiaceae bacterium RH CH11]VVB46965.1 Urease accessory protein UreE 1 [Beijerinckiaceae bacterium RH AL8]VVC55606.1 Urease accessory protein UreE 1 [Beijerinckiaceae bacterium RH AL1]